VHFHLSAAFALLASTRQWPLGARTVSEPAAPYAAPTFGASWKIFETGGGRQLGVQPLLCAMSRCLLGQQSRGKHFGAELLRYFMRCVAYLAAEFVGWKRRLELPTHHIHLTKVLQRCAGFTDKSDICAMTCFEAFGEILMETVHVCNMASKCALSVACILLLDGHVAAQIIVTQLVLTTIWRPGQDPYCLLHFLVFFFDFSFRRILPTAHAAIAHSWASISSSSSSCQSITEIFISAEPPVMHLRRRFFLFFFLDYPDQSFRKSCDATDIPAPPVLPLLRTGLDFCKMSGCCDPTGTLAPPPLPLLLPG
jgi:hypothetical protein